MHKNIIKNNNEKTYATIITIDKGEILGAYLLLYQTLI